MDSINALKGYGKVSHQENQVADQKPTRKRLLTVIAISATVLLILIISLIVAAVIHESKIKQPESSSSSSSISSSESMRAVCGVTPYPDSCFTSISSLNTSIKPDPEFVFNLSLKVSIAELSNLSSSIKTLNNLHGDAALRDCASLLEDAVSGLSDSVSAMEVGAEGKVLTAEKVNDLQTWISAAMTDQETCADGLEEMGETVVDEVKRRMQKSKELMSNSLAILAKMETLLEKFHLKMH
ncbi:pectinesterase 1 [Carica papaya]|uniref:pectinesterase 1 n=1 Tax=Carica papaya TaxID=3649 RepID=UPI000B8C7529|nr:pectinesterase 1 [Carica papaya]XP_021904646.1 pectinesterase 1 [Carica papaya]